MTENAVLSIATFGVASSAVALLALLLGGRRKRVDSRLADYAPPAAQTADRKALGSAIHRAGSLLMPKEESRVSKFKERLLQAGFYRRHATFVYLGVKFVLMVGPMAVGLLLAWARMLSLSEAVVFGSVVGLFGTVVPSLWMAYRKSNRQRAVRRALPDALDLIVVCLEGGLSLTAAFARVAGELQTAHPLLATELAIMRKEMELGRSTGAALRQLASRFDIEELRSMSTVVLQAERFGSSLVHAFRVHADSLRLKRNQHAEAMAEKAPLKLIFPTVLCIFPALYVVLMGPAAVHLLKLLSDID